MRQRSPKTGHFGFSLFRVSDRSLSRHDARVRFQQAALLPTHRFSPPNSVSLLCAPWICRSKNRQTEFFCPVPFLPSLFFNGLSYRPSVESTRQTTLFTHVSSVHSFLILTWVHPPGAGLCLYLHFFAISYLRAGAAYYSPPILCPGTIEGISLPRSWLPAMTYPFLSDCAWEFIATFARNFDL